jgi:hypothetical protein
MTLRLLVVMILTNGLGISFAFATIFSTGGRRLFKVVEKIGDLLVADLDAFQFVGCRSRVGGQCRLLKSGKPKGGGDRFAEGLSSVHGGSVC